MIRKLVNSDKVVAFIERFILNRQVTTIFEIQTYLAKILNFKFPKHEIRRILNEVLRYS